MNVRMRECTNVVVIDVNVYAITKQNCVIATHYMLLPNTVNFHTLTSKRTLLLLVLLPLLFIKFESVFGKNLQKSSLVHTVNLSSCNS